MEMVHMVQNSTYRGNIFYGRIEGGQRVEERTDFCIDWIDLLRTLVTTNSPFGAVFLTSEAVVLVALQAASTASGPAINGSRVWSREYTFLIPCHNRRCDRGVSALECCGVDM
jgi:hypothetical protein